jgi:hypothetical protein
MCRITNSSGNIPVTDNDKIIKDKKENTPEVKQEPALTKDNLNLNKVPQDNKFNSENIKLFDNEKSDAKPNGWKVKTVHFNAGYIIDNNVIQNSPMHVVNEKYGTDLMITNYHQIDRKNFESISFKPGERFAPDEPQFNLGVNVTFENNFGLELDGKHNKIIMDGYDQVVHFEGMMNGKYVNEDAPLNSYMAQQEHTYGNMQLNLLGTYTFDLPAPANHKFSFITKAGPSLITVASHSWIKNPDGQFEGGETKLNVAGYGGMIENGLRYQLGPNMGRLGIEATHSLSYVNYATYGMIGGYTGSNSAVYSTFAVKLTVGLSGNKK